MGWNGECVYSMCRVEDGVEEPKVGAVENRKEGLRPGKDDIDVEAGGMDVEVVCIGARDGWRQRMRKSRGRVRMANELPWLEPEWREWLAGWVRPAWWVCERCMVSCGLSPKCAAKGPKALH